MSDSISEQLRFSPAAGFVVWADFNGGGLSSDLGPLLLREVDRQIGLTDALPGRCMTRDIPVTSSIPRATCCETTLLFRLGIDRKLIDADEALASSATISRCEHAATRKDMYRFARVLME
jgi:hypothetical protein